LNEHLVRNTLQPESRRTLDTLDVFEQRMIFGERVVKSITLRENGETHRFIESVRLYSKEKLTAMLTAVGLRVHHYLGDYHGAEFHQETSPRLILIAQK
jgi:hypothetical protein